MFKRRKLSKRKQLLLLVGVISTLILVFRKHVFYSVSQQSKQPLDEKLAVREYSTVEKMPNGYIFSVTLDGREHYLASKVDRQSYELLYVPHDHHIDVCQAVYTTGLDHQYQSDVLVGYVAFIENAPNSIYSSIRLALDPVHCLDQ